ASGAFMQVGGLKFTYDTSKQAQEVEPGSGGTIVTPGERVQDVTLDDGTVIVQDGKVVDGPPVTIATNDFSARGGDDYPFDGLEFTPVGVTYQGSLEGYLTEGLSGKITAEDYPEGGEGRITPVGCPDRLAWRPQAATMTVTSSVMSSLPRLSRRNPPCRKP